MERKRGLRFRRWFGEHPSSITMDVISAIYHGGHMRSAFYSDHGDGILKWTTTANTHTYMGLGSRVVFLCFRPVTLP
jgi:hypothetical protein